MRRVRRARRHAPRRAAPSVRRRAKSIGASSARAVPRGSGPGRASTSDGRRARGWQASSASSQMPCEGSGPTGPSNCRLRIPARMSSVTSSPLRVRVTTTEEAASTAATRGQPAPPASGAGAGVPSGAAAHRHVHDVTSSCSEGVPGVISSAAVASTPTGKRRRQPAGQGVDVEVRLPSYQLDIQILGHGLVAGGEGQPEADLGTRGEAGAVGDRQLHPAKRPLPHAGHVPVTGPADLPELGEADPDPGHGRAPAPANGPQRTPAPRGPGVRSWPVPWLPPAGGVGDATTCSMPKPVQAPQS